MYLISQRKWQRTPLFLPGESHGQRSLVGYSPWGRKESDTTSLSLSLMSFIVYLFPEIYFLAFLLSNGVTSFVFVIEIFM